MAKGHIRNRTSKLPDCWLIIRSYFGEALFHTSVQKFDPSSREYCDWMGNVDGFDPCFKWSSIRPSGRSSDLPLPCRYRCISLGIVVVSCPVPKKKAISVARRYVLSERLGKDWLPATQRLGKPTDRMKHAPF